MQIARLTTCTHRPRIATRIAVVAIAWSAHAFAEQSFPTQQAWTYGQGADLMSGKPHPEANLMSRNTLPLPASTKQTNFGYLTVERPAAKPVVVALGIERRLPKAGALDCKPEGCIVKIRFDSDAAIDFHALPVKNWPERVVLQDSASFVKAASAKKRIEVGFQDLENGFATYQFSSAVPLQFEKIK